MAGERSIDPLPVVSLGHGLPFATADDALAAAAARIAALQPGVAADALRQRLGSPHECVASLRGRLLLLEVACAGLAAPYAFYLLGTAADVPWHGAPLRLFLFGLYKPEAIRSYVLASMQLERDRLTARSIRSWLDGASWPEAVP